MRSLMSVGRRNVAVLAAAGCLVACLAPGRAAASISASPSPHPVPAARSIALGGIAGVPAASPRTGTVYVPIQSGHVVAVLNAATCNARVASDCRVVARARVGTSPLAAVVDEDTDTIYVVNAPANAAGTVSVVNGAR